MLNLFAENRILFLFQRGFHFLLHPSCLLSSLGVEFEGIVRYLGGHLTAGDVNVAGVFEVLAANRHRESGTGHPARRVDVADVRQIDTKPR